MEDKLERSMDLVLWSNLEKVVYFIELSLPWEERVDKAYDLKKAKRFEMTWKLHG